MKGFDLNDVGIVIQGPTNNCESVLSNLDQSFSYVWSTWDNEPIENIKAIANQVPIILNTTPSFKGYNNINLQCMSSEAGIRAINKPWIVKVRGDLLWTNQKGVIRMAFEKMIKEDSLCSYLNYKPSIHEMHDFVTFSGLNYALDLWSYRQVGPDFNQPEKQLCYNIMKKNGWTYEEMVDKMSFINVDLVKDSLDIHCIRYNCDMSENAHITIDGNEAFPKR
jgi:hypothetical protein